MKHFYTLCILFLLGCLLGSSAALAVDVEAEQKQALGIHDLEAELPDAASEILGDYSVMDSLDFQGKLNQIKDKVGENLGAIIKTGLKSAGTILIVVLLCSLSGSLYEGQAVPDFVPLGGVLIISAIAIGDVKSFIGLGAETLQTIGDFSKILLPTLSAAAAAAGAVTSAAAKYAATALFMDVLLTVSIEIIMPLVYVFVALTIANSAMGNDALGSAVKISKWTLTSLITLLMIAFTGYLSLTGVISGTSDAVATRVAKTTLSTALPVVGGIIADAAGTVVAGAAILKNAIGVFGMLAIICVCMMPFLSLGVQYLLYKLASGLSDALTDKRLGGLIGGIGSAFGFVLALVGSGALMLFFSIISSIKAVSGI